MEKLDNSNIDIHLGKTSQYKSTYDPSLLVREPRQSNRTHINIVDEDLPFVGYDTWNAYEISGLTDNGLPVTGVAKIVYSCSSKYIVESKSIKLYFNTFNMTCIGDTADSVRKNIALKAADDLSKLLETEVQVKVFDPNQLSKCIITPDSEWDHDFYETLEDTVDNLSEINFNVYTETPALLEVKDNTDEVEVFSYHSSLLKSNCRVTSQPDWGDVYINYSGSKTVTKESLLKYIVSFRDECHFHEEICETIYKRLWDLISPKHLSVTCLYVRRGGIDICPERASNDGMLHYTLSNPCANHIKTSRQ